jgi:hypothetical protein
LPRSITFFPAITQRHCSTTFQAFSDAKSAVRFAKQHCSSCMCNV